MRTRSRLRRRPKQADHPSLDQGPDTDATPPMAFEIEPNDPLLAFFQQSPGPVDIERLKLESVALETMRAAGVKLAVPLVSQGELIGVLNLGPRLSEQEYSA